MPYSCVSSFDLSPVSIVVASVVAEDGRQREGRQRDDEADGDTT
jgi:hypothetical protein